MLQVRVLPGQQYRIIGTCGLLASCWRARNAAVDSVRLSVIVLADGDGSRMHSARPKPLHRICGRPMVRYVLDGLDDLDVDRVVAVVGVDGQRVAKELADTAPVTEIVEQQSRRGTGAAVLSALPTIIDHELFGEEEHDVIIVPADVPLLRGEWLSALWRTHREADASATVLTGRMDDAGGLARVVRREKDESVLRVIDAKDLVGTERSITEFATGIWCVRASMLAPAIRRLEPDHEIGEIPLSGIAGVLADTGNRVMVHHEDGAVDLVGINDRVDLASTERLLRGRINHGWLDRGVTMIDPAQTYIDSTVSLATDVTLFPGAILQGTTIIGEGTEVGPGTRLIDTRVGAGCRLDHTTAELATIGDDCRVGPYAVLSAGAEIPAATVTGPFYTAGPDGP
jgi:bifunctional UDP-N-acetylglucosamine pyrophosphorylase / glucosamine-1-phosphate N-acetyltransferase